MTVLQPCDQGSVIKRVAEFVVFRESVKEVFKSLGGQFIVAGLQQSLSKCELVMGEDAARVPH